MSPKNESVVTSFVDAVMGGESHSPDTEINEGTLPDESEGFDENGNADGEVFIETSEPLDSSKEPDAAEVKPEVKAEVKTEVKPEAKPEVKIDTGALNAEIEKLNKRLHDTQSSFHKASQERAALQKELDELKKKKDSGDDWFSEEDQAKAAKLETEIKNSDSKHGELDEKIKKLEEDQAIALWTAAETPVKEKNPDYDKVVYEVLSPSLEKDAQLKAEWDKTDKSPKAAYELGKKYAERQELLANPEAYKEKLRKEVEAEYANKPKTKTVSTPTGKVGLDATNSESVSSGNKAPPTGSFVDSIFK